MKLKDLMEKYGEYELYTDSPKHIEDAFKNLGSKDDGVLCLYVKKPKPKTVWDLERGENYLCITETGEVLLCENVTTYLYEKKREIGNVFLEGQQKEAEKDVERRKVETLLLKYGGRRWFKCDTSNWVIRYNHIQSSFEYGYLNVTQYSSCIYFDTKEQAQKAVEQIGEERIKKALFEVR